MKKFICYEDLRRLGFGQSQARRIIRLTKKKLVEEGYGFYNGKRVGLVPTNKVAEVIGASPDLEGQNDSN